MNHLRLSLLVLLLSCTQILPAQWSLGLRSGYVRAWQDYGDFVPPEDAQIHVHRWRINAQIYRQLSPYISVGVEPGWVQRGAACLPGFLVPFPGDLRLNVRYLELPLMLRAQWPIGPLSIRGQVGYSTSVAVQATSQRVSLTGETPDDPPVPMQIGRLGVRRWDPGLYGSLGLAWRHGRQELSLTSHYYHGLRHAVAIEESQNRGLSVEFGYAFLLGEK
ncbi:MAG: hypothetical protein AAF804_18535 [Bacteroidota bacterium]